MVSDEWVGILFLAYLIVPLLLFFFFWLFGWFRRRVLKVQTPEDEREGEA